MTEINPKDYIKMIWSIVHHYGGTIEERKERFQIGALAMLKAIEKFDPTRGIMPSSYLYVSIKGEISKHILRKENPWKTKVQFFKGEEFKLESKGTSIEEEIEQKKLVEQLLSSPELKREQKNLLKKYFGLGEENPISAPKIAEEEGVSSTIIYRRINKAILTLKEKTRLT